MKRIPILLIYSRILTGLFIVILSLWQPMHFRAIIISLISAGLLSDILDGIIARHTGSSTEKLRRLDSSADQVFWIMVLIATGIIAPAFYKTHIIQIAVILSFEALAYLVCFIKFKKEVATHALLSKIWTLTIFATLVQVVATGTSSWLFTLCFCLGIFTRTEIILIILVMNTWTNDVPSLYHAIRSRKGEKINRNKWLNG